MLKSQKVHKLIEEAQEFFEKNLTSGNPKFKAWNADVIRLIEQTYGEASTDAKRFRHRLYAPGWYYGISDNEYNKAFEDDLRVSIEELKRLEEEIDEAPERFSKTNNKNNPQNINVNVSNIINNNMNLTCNDIKEIIENDSMIGDIEKKELITKLEEIETLQKSNMKKNDKWKNAKEIFKFILDKGADIAIMYIPQILKAIS